VLGAGEAGEELDGAALLAAPGSAVELLGELEVVGELGVVDVAVEPVVGSDDAVSRPASLRPLAYGEGWVPDGVVGGVPDGVGTEAGLAVGGMTTGAG
jgi:hypothetical protein